MSARETPRTPGEALVYLRESAGMTLDEVAQSAGVSASYLSRVETGEKRATPGYIGIVTEVIAARLGSP